MNWQAPAEQAALGFLGYGTLSIALSASPAGMAISALAGGLIHLAFAALRPLPWKRYFQNSTSACASVSRDFRFLEVSTRAPERMAFIRVQHLTKKELFKRLEGKRLNPITVPLHIRAAIEEKRPLDLPWEAVEPFLI